MMAVVSLLVAGLVIAFITLLTKFERQDKIATICLLIAFVIGGIMMGPDESAYRPENSVCGRGCPPELRGRILIDL
ncbi:hypothetical protein [Haematobacter missouriensis]|mgnify:FL=1|nr:hypothetical protein [Haematobacter missouriensis]